jgi:hypothetical protein
MKYKIGDKVIITNSKYDLNGQVGIICDFYLNCDCVECYSIRKFDNFWGDFTIEEFELYEKYVIDSKLERICK